MSRKIALLIFLTLSTFIIFPTSALAGPSVTCAPAVYPSSSCCESSCCKSCCKKSCAQDTQIVSKRTFCRTVKRCCKCKTTNYVEFTFRSIDSCGRTKTWKKVYKEGDRRIAHLDY